MLITQLKQQGITDEKIIAAIDRVPREQFLPQHLRDLAYENTPLPIGFEQTISQPYIVAFMTEALNIKSSDKILEIGTGSGYQAAILAEFAAAVYSIEINEFLLKRADAALNQLGYKNIYTKHADGYFGWNNEAPFDKIILTAAPARIPEPLIEQLKVGGILIMPIGNKSQELIKIIKTRNGLEKTTLLPVRFVPMTGIAAD